VPVSDGGHVNPQKKEPHMFTIKHCTPLGNESVIQTPEVTYSPHPTPAPAEDGRTALTGTVFYIRPGAGGEQIELRTGTVYVMNDAGSTVAKYDLGGWGDVGMTKQ
jgi:archaellin